MRGWLAGAIGAALLLGAVLFSAPAALLDTRIAALSGGRIRLTNAIGTIWNGSGELVLLPAGTRQPLRWRLDALPLFAGEVRAAIATGPESAPSATVLYAGDHFELRGLDLGLPVESLLRVATAAKIALGIGGSLRVHVDHLVERADALDAQLTLQWDDASVPGPRVDTRIALGAVRAELNGRGAELNGPVSNSGGDVEITGQFAVLSSGTARLEVTFRPRSSDRERAAMVTAALSTLGVPDGQGGYHVNWAGKWR